MLDNAVFLVDILPLLYCAICHNDTPGLERDPLLDPNVLFFCRQTERRLLEDVLSHSDLILI